MCTGDDGFALIFVCWIYGTDIVLTVHKQAVRLYSFGCVHAFESVINWVMSLQSFSLIRYFTVQIHYNGNDGSTFAESMEQRVSRWP